MIITQATANAGRVPRGSSWPFDIPAVRSLVERGLTLDTPVTFLVGENASGKSTIVEALAEAYGADVRGGHIGRKYATTVGKGSLGAALELRFANRAMQRKPKGFFLRAETAYGVFEFMSDHQVPGYGAAHLLEVSHGESFLQVFGARFGEPGLYLLDEPEAALSFSSCLSLLAVLHDPGQSGAQVICATHSPLLASLPGASVLQLSGAGIERVAWQDLDLVAHWREYLTAPERYLRHLIP